MDYKEMINHLPILIYGLEYDPKLGPQSGRIKYANTSLTKFIGYTEQEIVAMGFDFYRAVIHPDDLHKTSKTIAVLLNSDKTEHTEFYRTKAKNSNKYEIMKGILKIVTPIPAEGPIQFVATTLFATSEEILKYYLTIEIANDLFDSLSERERGIALLITKGKIDKEIADELFISALTVKTHRTNIRKKLQVKNTAEMVTYLLPRLQHY
jgi:DNA-binding CsgD family transcriptional regulator